MPFPSSWKPEAGSLDIDGTPDTMGLSLSGRVSYAELATLLATTFPGADYGAACPVSGLTHLRANRLKIRAFGQKSNTTINGVAIPDDGFIASIGYTTVPSQELPAQQTGGDADPITLLEHRWTSSVEVIEIGVEGMRWALDDVPVENEIQGTYKIPVIEHEITKPRWKQPPFDAIKELLGTINSHVMSFQTGKIWTETLSFMGAGLQRSILSNGDGAWRVSYRFSERRVPDPETTTAVLNDQDQPTTFGGWNHFWRKWEDAEATFPIYPGFYRLNRANGDPIYTLGDHRLLFPKTP